MENENILNFIPDPEKYNYKGPTRVIYSAKIFGPNIPSKNELRKTDPTLHIEYKSPSQAKQTLEEILEQTLHENTFPRKKALPEMVIVLLKSPSAT